MSTGLQGAELNYPAVDKQAYAVFKAVKQFRPYILKNPLLKLYNYSNGGYA